ncbi:hypothetical protein ACIQC5_22170 [Paenarthrobacter sp. NPDC092416]|uniref:hypothetical protein n=1 Tax=Paenarthrobacter sp. NPDC092416 TaxID=3364386 RepID=UPI0037F39711
MFLDRMGMPKSPCWLWSVSRQGWDKALAKKYLPDDVIDDVRHEDARKGSIGRLFSNHRAVGWRSGYRGAHPVFGLSSFNAGYNTLANEIRGIGPGFAAALSGVGADIGIFLMPMSMESPGPGPTMLIAAAVALAGAGLSQWLAPATKERH